MHSWGDGQTASARDRSRGAEQNLELASQWPNAVMLNKGQIFLDFLPTNLRLTTLSKPNILASSPRKLEPRGNRLGVSHARFSHTHIARS
jgi:hypothetical protein